MNAGARPDNDWTARGSYALAYLQSGKNEKRIRNAFELSTVENVRSTRVNTYTAEAATAAALAADVADAGFFEHSFDQCPERPHLQIEIIKKIMNKDPCDICSNFETEQKY